MGSRALPTVRADTLFIATHKGNTMNLQPNPTAPIDGTSFMGTIQATPSQLERAFGEPEVSHPEDSVPLRWTLVNADLDPNWTVATIYLWKKPVPNSNEPATWNIGGHTRHVVELVHDAFRERLGLSARAA